MNGPVFRHGYASVRRGRHPRLGGVGLDIDLGHRKAAHAASAAPVGVTFELEVDRHLHHVGLSSQVRDLLQRLADELFVRIVHDHHALGAAASPDLVRDVPTDHRVRFRV